MFAIIIIGILSEIWISFAGLIDDNDVLRTRIMNQLKAGIKDSS